MTLNLPLQQLKRLFHMASIHKFLGSILLLLFGTVFTFPVLALPEIKPVQMEQLAPLSLNTLGIKQILPAKIWIKSDPQKVTNLIEKTSKKNLSPDMRDKVIALLTSDTGGVYWANNPYAPDRFLMTRLNALLELGAFSQVIQLINQIPVSNKAPKFIRLKAMTDLLAGNTNEACAVVEAPELSRIADEMRLACLMVQGDMTKAKLAYAVYKEDGGDDKTLIALADRVFDETKAPLPDIKIYAPWHVPFLAALGDKIPDVLDQPLWLKKSLAGNKNIPIAKRISFAEQSGVTWRNLDALYRAVFPKSPEVNSSITRAHLYQKMKNTPDKIEQAKAVNAFLESARKDKLFKAIAPITEETLFGLTPSDQTSFLAFNAVQVFALTDNLSMGHPWYEYLRKNPDKNLKNQAFLLSPLMNKMGAGIPEAIDPILIKCKEKPTPYCTQFVQMIPDYFPIENADLLLDLAPAVKSAYTPLTKMALAKMIKDGKTGEAVLWTINLLTDSDNYEKEILDTFSEILPLYLARPILIERMVYE